MIPPSPINGSATRQLSDNVKLTQQAKMQQAKQHQAQVRAQQAAVPQQSVAPVPPVDPSSPVPQQQMVHTAHVHPGMRLAQINDTEKQAFLQAAALLPLLPWLGRAGLSVGRWLLPRMLGKNLGGRAVTGIGNKLLAAKSVAQKLPGAGAAGNLMQWARNPWTQGAAFAPLAYSMMGDADNAGTEMGQILDQPMPGGGRNMPSIYNVDPQARRLYQMVHSASDSSSDREREAALKLWKMDKHVRSRFF